MNSFKKFDVLSACTKYGPLLEVPAGLDGERVMLSFASNESSTGSDCGPRHEPSYDVGGSVWASSPAQRALVSQYGRLGASSFGPWQLMLINCPGCTPDELQINLDMCARQFVGYFNRYVAHFDPTNLNQIGQIYNLGHKTTNPPAGVVAYCEKLQKAYDYAVKMSS